MAPEFRGISGLLAQEKALLRVFVTAASPTTTLQGPADQGQRVLGRLLASAPRRPASGRTWSSDHGRAPATRYPGPTRRTSRRPQPESVPFASELPSRPTPDISVQPALNGRQPRAAHGIRQGPGASNSMPFLHYFGIGQARTIDPPPFAPWDEWVAEACRTRTRCVRCRLGTSSRAIATQRLRAAHGPGRTRRRHRRGVSPSVYGRVAPDWERFAFVRSATYGL